MFKNCEHEKLFRITKFLKILIIIILRFDKLNNTKILCDISFEERLNLKKYVDTDFILNEDCVYELKGIINHDGELELGHYYSYVKLEKNNFWYEFIDDRIKKIHWEFSGNNNVYSLINLSNKVWSIIKFKS